MRMRCGTKARSIGERRDRGSGTAETPHVHHSVSRATAPGV